MYPDNMCICSVGWHAVCTLFSQHVCALECPYKDRLPWALIWLEYQIQWDIFSSPRMKSYGLLAHMLKVNLFHHHLNLKPSAASPFSKRGRGPSGVCRVLGLSNVPLPCPSPPQKLSVSEP